jgi:pilus assembly protein CpaF
MNVVQSLQTPPTRPIPGRDRGPINDGAASGTNGDGARAVRPPVATPPNGAKPRQQYLDLKASVHRKLLNRLNLEALANADRARAEGEIRTLLHELLAEEGMPLNLTERDLLFGEILDDVFGLGPLEPLLRDGTISDILVNTYKNVFVERGGVLERIPATFQDDKHLLRVIDRIVSAVGRRIDDSSPLVDARLLDGSRVNAIIPPLAVDGPLLSIRRFPAERLKSEDLVTLRALTKPMLDFLTHCVRARLNVLISGGTGAGKTTLLNVLSGFISERERIVTIEDAAELQLHQEHVARLETRPPNIEGKGAIKQRQLVINALRMRPDRIVVGEVRGEEALDMLQAMNTGHDGSLTTIHANTPRDALGRIETMVAMGTTNLPERAMRQQIASAIQVVVQQTRLSDGSRKITAISEITGMEGDVITMQEIFVFEKVGVTQDGKVIGRFRATGVRPKVCERLKASGIHLSTEMFEGVTEVR